MPNPEHSSHSSHSSERRTFLRRDILKIGAAATGGVGLELVKPAVALSQQIENGSVYNFSAAFEAYPGYFFPTFAHLRPVLDEFAEAHYIETQGEDISSDLNRAMGIYDGRSAQGICNGFTNFYCSQKGQLPDSGILGGRRFSWEKIAALGSLAHYCDEWEVQQNGGRTFDLRDTSMIYLHHMLYARLRNGQAFGVDTSDRAQEMWSSPVDKATVTKFNIGGGWVEVKARMRTATYLDPRFRSNSDYKFLDITYQINEQDVSEGGNLVSSNFNLRHIWIPTKVDDPNCHIRENVLRQSAQESISKLVGYPI